MTAERFKMTSELPKGWVDIIDTDNNQTLCNIRIEYANHMVNLLNELHNKYIDEYALRETLQLELQRVEEENKTLKTRFKEERELAMKLGSECDTLTIKKQELELEIIRLETIIRTGDDDDYNRAS